MSSTKTESNPWREWFKVEGKRYRLFKRQHTKDAPWYIYFERNRRRILRSLETNVKDAAIANAKIIIAAARSEKWALLEGTRSSRPLASIGECLQVFRQNPEGLKTVTIGKHVSALRCVLRTAGVLSPTATDEDLARLSTSELTAALVSRYRAAVVKSADPEDEHDPAVRKARISANSYLRQARSIFSRHMLEHYQARGLHLPADLEKFRKAPGFRKVRIEYSPPDDKLLMQTFELLERLWTTKSGKARDRRRAVYTAVCLACGAGLRKSEISRAKWSWFVQRDGSAWVQSDTLAKNGSVVDVPVVSDWWPRLRKIRAYQLRTWRAQRRRGRRPLDDFLLEGTMTQRTEEVFRWVGRWMRRLGWKTEKAIHEFRAWVGSKVAERYGFALAAKFLRHGDESTTRRFYGRYVKMKEMKLEGLAA
jgi:integrase